ncbi:hypothetical protein BDV93DRAFT_518305 [Ceratobasidium sp. AG-I]|nr:hypothetical protein BDV93DRAFT_518305 [Ceratobasidium sp. AG-I]
MDVVSEHSGGGRTEGKYSDPPIGYTNVRRREARPPQTAIDVHQSEEEDELLKDEDARDTQTSQDGPQLDSATLNQMQSRIQALLPMLTSTSRTERHPSEALAFVAGSNRDANARFARAPSSSGFVRSRGGAPGISPREHSRGLPQRQDSTMTVSESSMMSGASPSGGLDQSGRQQSIQSDGDFSDMPYRRPGKHRVGESPTPEEYMSLPPEAKKKVDNRLSARRSRAKRKEHVHVLTAQINEQQNTIEMLRIENKQLNDHIANLSRAGYSLHPPPFQPGLVPHHPHPSPHLRHAPIPPPSHIHSGGRHLPPVHHSSLPPPLPSGSPRRSHVLASPTVSSHPSIPGSASGLVSAAAPPTGPGQVPILAHGRASSARSESGASYVAQGQSSVYDSPGRGTKREVEDERDDRLRTRIRYASPEHSNWDRESGGRRMSHSGYRSPPQPVERYYRYSKQAGPARDGGSPPPSPSHTRWSHLPPSLAASQSGHSRPADYDPAEEVLDRNDPIEITGQGTFSDRLATLIRVHKRAIVTYKETRQGQYPEQEGMKGLLGAAEAIGKEVEELTNEFHYVGQED